MRILLIATNRHKQLNSRMNAQPLPIGLAYIAGYLDPTRHTVKMLDLMFSDDHYLDEAERTARAFEPELVGISIRNLSNHSYLDPQWQLPITKAVIERLRVTIKAPIVWAARPLHSAQGMLCLCRARSWPRWRRRRDLCRTSGPPGRRRALVYRPARDRVSARRRNYRQ